MVFVRFGLSVGLFGSICLFASASAAPARSPSEDSFILAQNPPSPTQPQSEEEKAKERKKAPAEKAAPKNEPPAKGPIEKKLPGVVPPPKGGPGQPPANKNLPSLEKEVPKPPAAAPKIVPLPPRVTLPPQAHEPEKKAPAPAERMAPAIVPKGPAPGAATPTKPGLGPAEKFPAPGGAPNAPAPQGMTPAPSSGKTLLQPKAAPKPGQAAAPGTRVPGATPERAALPKAPPPQGPQPGLATTFTPGFQPPGPPAQHLQDLQRSRTEHTEAGGKRTVIEEPDNRVIVKQDNRVFVRHDETLRLADRASNVRSERRADGTTETIIARPGGIQIYNVVDSGGRLIRRYRRDEAGHEIDLIDNRRFYRDLGTGLAIAVGVGLAAEVIALNLPPPVVGIPPEKYIVDYDRASDEDIDEALAAPPVEGLERGYSLEEIRYNAELRDRMRRIDLDAINFDSGAWDVPPDQYAILARVAAAINRMIDRNPAEVFMIEGYTDAVGSDIDNLSLSDRRAQSVAEILTDEFDVPPENLVTQGYGKQYLKIPTDGPERANRRVAVRRITPLMSQGDDR